MAQSVSGKGFNGVSCADFECDIYTNIDFNEDSEIEFADNYLKQIVPGFMVTKAQRRGNIVHITAHDRCKNLDIPFDYSSYQQFDTDGHAMWYGTGDIVSAIASQCGFTGYSLSENPRITSLCFNDFAGKSCRQILVDLSIADVGFWHCVGKVLKFCDLSHETGYEIADSDRSELILTGTKTIKGIYAISELDGKEYDLTGSSWRNAERISGRYVGEYGGNETQTGIKADIVGTTGEYKYIGWSCNSILFKDSIIYTVGERLCIEGHSLPILNAEYSFTAMGIVASMSAPAPDTSFSEYHDLYSRAIEERLQTGRSYGGFFMGVNGFGVRSGGEYLYRADASGVVTYDRYQLDKELPNTIEEVSKTSRRMIYNDASYLVSWSVDPNTGKRTNIHYERESDGS